MSISSTRKISSSASVSSRIDRRSLLANNHSQFVENIDTTNNVLVRDESNGESRKHDHQPPNNEDATNYNSSNPNIVNGIEAIASSIALDEQGYSQIHKIDVYSNNQSIVYDEEVEHTGRNYLKHFYEKNEHMIDVDELV